MNIYLNALNATQLAQLYVDLIFRAENTPGIGSVAFYQMAKEVLEAGEGNCGRKEFEQYVETEKSAYDLGYFQGKAWFFNENPVPELNMFEETPCPVCDRVDDNHLHDLRHKEG